MPDPLLKTKKFDNSGVAGIEPIRNETLESCTNNERCGNGPAINLIPFQAFSSFQPPFLWSSLGL